MMGHVTGESRYQVTLCPEVLDEVVGRNDPVGVCRAFIRFCREQSLFGAELLAIDGTKIAAVASRKRVITPAKIAKMNAAIDRKIADYLASMDEADREEPKAASAQADVAAAIEALKAQKERLQSQAEELAARGLKQLVVTEPEAKLMRTPHGHAVAYNAQTAVDAKHKLIVAFELTNEGNDYWQLYPMAAQAKDAVGADEVMAVADTGYSNGEHGALCEQDGITAVVPRAETVNPNGPQYFSRDRFSYDRESAGDRQPGMDEASPGNGRTSVWHDEVADGPSPVLAARIEKSESGTGVGRAVLQSQTGGQHPWGGGAAASA